MTDSIVLTGVVATAPRSVTTSEGLSITSFRLASALRRYDKPTSTWVDAGTNWYSVSAFRRLAENAAESLEKGDRVIVSGRIRLREWESAGRNGMTVEVEAEAIGHDLNWGASVFRKKPAQGGAECAPAAGGDAENATEPRAQESTGPVAEASWASAPLATPF